MILRNVLENPAWYTAYTPYQPEISQGRLEALLNFQTMVTDLTGMEIANASMLDESTAAAEAMTLIRRSTKHPAPAFFVDAETHPQTIAVVAARAEPIGIELVVGDLADLDPAAVFGALLQHPGTSGVVRDLSPTIAAVHDAGGLVAVATDLLACTLLTPPGEQGADVCVGSSQRFGVPLGYGGPHAGLPRHPRRRCAARCPAASSACPSTPPVAPPTASPCRPVSSTSGGRRRPRTSAPPRCSWRSSRRCTPCTTAPRGSGTSPSRCTASTARLAAAPRAPRASRSSHDAFFDTLTVRAAGRADELVADGARRRA